MVGSKQLCLIKANVMLEYPIQEAIDLLQSKLDSANISSMQVTEDLEFLKVLLVNLGADHHHGSEHGKSVQ
jgi:hypothetical protein